MIGRQLSKHSITEKQRYEVGLMSTWWPPIGNY